MAAESLFGSNWQSDSRFQVLHCAIDLTPFEGEVDSKGVRSELGIPEAAHVIGHVGRFDSQKNHRFLIDVFACIAHRDPMAWLVLVGDGSLRSEIEQRARTVGIANRTIFTGVRSDVPRLMRGAFDVHLFPSAWEGLGLVHVESQAAGLPSVISDVVPQEADIVNTLIRRLPLSAPVSEWADAVCKVLYEPPEKSDHAHLRVSATDFNIANAIDRLTTIYSSTSAVTKKVAR